MGPARPERSTLKLNRAPRLKKRFSYFGGEPKENESRKAREQIDSAENSVARPPKRAYSAGLALGQSGRIAAGDVWEQTRPSFGCRAAPAERQRSRSEANTGRRTGASFGLQLFFGCENRLRFSRRAGPSMGLRFGQWIGLSCWLGFGPSFCGSLSRAVRRHPMRRTATRRSSLHSPLAANSYRLRANSEVPRGIAVLGRSDAIAARGAHSEDE